MRGGIDGGFVHFRPWVVGVVHVRRICDPGMGIYHLRVRRDFDVVPRYIFAARCLHEPTGIHKSVSSCKVWGFHTLRGGIDPGDVRFSFELWKLWIHIWKDLRSGDGTLSSADVTGSVSLSRWGGASTPCGYIVRVG